jgi:hypothetical protein
MLEHIARDKPLNLSGLNGIEPDFASSLHGVSTFIKEA